MTYSPQPGTIPHRAVEWLKSMQAVRPGYEPTTAEFVEALDVDSYGFTACMRVVREKGLVHATQYGDARSLRWKLGGGRPDPALVPAHLERFDATVEGKSKPAKPRQVVVPASEFRALMWEGQLLATGMEIRDGVAIFTPEHVAQIKRHTDWVQGGAA